MKRSTTGGGSWCTKVGAGGSLPAFVGLPEQAIVYEAGSDRDAGTKGGELIFSDEVELEDATHGSRYTANDVIDVEETGTSIARALAGGDSSSSMSI